MFTCLPFPGDSRPPGSPPGVGGGEGERLWSNWCPGYDSGACTAGVSAFWLIREVLLPSSPGWKHLPGFRGNPPAYFALSRVARACGESPLGSACGYVFAGSLLESLLTVDDLGEGGILPVTFLGLNAHCVSDQARAPLFGVN